MKKVFIISLALIMVAAGVAFAQLTGTDHQIAGVANNEICAACHTPHAAAGNTYGPLWNRSQVAQTYQYYANSTFDMSQPGTDILGSQSVACMTCHNGVGSVIVNAPGPGGAGAVVPDPYTVGVGNTINGQAFSNISTDLRDDHPVGFTYDEALDTAFPAPVGDLIAGTYPLYAGQFECATCHDVHNSAGVGDGSNEVYFLRATNNGSAMCLDCHTDK